MTHRELVLMAEEAMGHAYAPYSGFHVGAALLTKDGRVYPGCNIENASYSVTNCAERTALFRAVYDGARAFAALAVVGGRNGVIAGICAPCGVCRQALAEFCEPDMPVLLGTGGGSYELVTLAELLPHSFSSKNLSKSME